MFKSEYMIFQKESCSSLHGPYSLKEIPSVEKKTIAIQIKILRMTKRMISIKSPQRKEAKQQIQEQTTDEDIPPIPPSVLCNSIDGVP